MRSIRITKFGWLVFLVFSVVVVLFLWSSIDNQNNEEQIHASSGRLEQCNAIRIDSCLEKHPPNKMEPFRYCIEHKSCSSCVEDDLCVWCSSLGVCMNGESEGPYYGWDEPFCSSWTYDVCPGEEKPIFVPKPQPAAGVDYSICSTYTSCEECSLHPHCGWCHSSDSMDGVCQGGSEAGAFGAECEWWDWWQCEGIIYVWKPTGVVTGGSEAMATVSSTLNKLGLRSLEYKVQTPYINKYSRGLNEFHHHKFGPLDTLVICGGCSFEGAHMIMERNSTMVQFFMGYHNPNPMSQKVNNWIPLCYQHAMLDKFDCGATYLDIPVATYWYREAMKRKNFYDLKVNYIMYDPDWGFNPSTMVTHPDGIHFQAMAGFSRPDLLEAFKKAKLQIDLALPGYEWGNLEATLMDVPVIFGGRGAGRSVVDYTFDENLHATTLEQVNQIIDRAVRNYTELAIEFRSFKQHVFDMRLKFLPRMKKFFSDNIHFYTIAITQDQKDSVCNFIATAILGYGLGSVEVLVDETESLTWNHFQPITYLQHLYPRSFSIRTIPKEYLPYKEKAIYMIPPQKIRKYTMILNVTSVLIGTDITQAYSDYFLKHRSDLMFINREVAPEKLSSTHFFHTKTYYQTLDKFLDQQQMSVFPPSSPHEQNGHYLYRFMLEVFKSGVYSPKVPSRIGSATESDFKKLLLKEELTDAIIPFEVVEELRERLILSKEQADSYAAIMDLPLWNFVHGYNFPRVHRILSTITAAVFKAKDCWNF